MFTLIYWIFMIALAIALGVYVLAFGGLIFAGWNFYKNKQWLAKQPTEMVCPNCGSTEVQFQNIASGANSISYGKKLRTGRTKIENKHVATCQRCGHTFEYVTALDIDNMIARTRTNIYLGLGASVIGFILLISSVFSSSK